MDGHWAKNMHLFCYVIYFFFNIFCIQILHSSVAFKRCHSLNVYARQVWSMCGVRMRACLVKQKKSRVFSHCLLLDVYESASEHYLTIGVYNKVRLQTESKKIFK